MPYCRASYTRQQLIYSTCPVHTGPQRVVYAWMDQPALQQFSLLGPLRQAQPLARHFHPCVWQPFYAHVDAAGRSSVDSIMNARTAAAARTDDACVTQAAQNTTATSQAVSATSQLCCTSALADRLRHCHYDLICCCWCVCCCCRRL
jgi:hypothetical protein